MLTVKNLYKSYETAKTRYPVLKGISFHVKKGEFTAVMGASGSGKSTLLNCISCYIPYDKGEILLGEQNLSGLDQEGLAEAGLCLSGFYAARRAKRKREYSDSQNHQREGRQRSGRVRGETDGTVRYFPYKR